MESLKALIFAIADFFEAVPRLSVILETRSLITHDVRCAGRQRTVEQLGKDLLTSITLELDTAPLASRVCIGLNTELIVLERYRHYFRITEGCKRFANLIVLAATR